MSFYDIVLDFVIMDSFDDLEKPPYALTAVIQNGWIPNSVKLSVSYLNFHYVYNDTNILFIQGE